MLFPTHLLVAAGIGWLSRRRRTRRGLATTTALATAPASATAPTLSVWWLVAGAALPDVIDKPLGTLGVVDVYQSVGHSALLAPLALVVAARHRHGLSVAVGWGSHLALDALHMVVNGRAGDAVFLGWPVLTRPDPLALPPIEFALFYVGTPAFFLEVALWLVAIVVVVRSRFNEGVNGGGDR